MQNIITKGWGYELWIVNNNLYCGKELCVLPNKWCSVHFHKNKTETFYIISGELLLEYSSPNEAYLHSQAKEFWNEYAHIETKILKKGDSITLLPFSPHKFTSHTFYPCTFIEFSTHHEDSDSYRIIKGD